MTTFDSEFTTRVFNIVLTAIILVIALCVLAARAGKGSAYARADRFSLAVRLPYGSEETRVSIARALRRRAIATSLAMLAGALVSAVLLATPLATSPLFLFYTLVAALLLGNVVGTVVTNVGERLFAPAPDSTRIARARTMRASDYVDPFRRALPWALAAAAAIALVLLVVTVSRTRDRVDAAAAAATVTFAIVGVFAFIALPWLERLILAQPQPATHSLELAWDDALRAGAIASLRLGCALVAWFALSLAIIAVLVGADPSGSWWVGQLPTWGIIALQFVYPDTGRHLPRALYPDWLRQPIPAGGPR